MKKNLPLIASERKPGQLADLEILDFSDVDQLEESIAPVFVAVFSAADSGGTCKKYGCLCLSA